MLFNTKRCLHNIYDLANKQGRKIRDLEDAAGVSRGYLSRLIRKEASASISVEPLAAIAEVLGVSLDFLLYFDGEKFGSSEQLLLKFIDALKQKSVAKLVEWSTDPAASFNRSSYRELPTCDHPLVDVIIDEDDDHQKYYKLWYKSQFNRWNTICGDSYRANLDDYSVVYVMRVRGLSGGATNGIEIYIQSDDSIKAICCTFSVRKEVSEGIWSLVKTIQSVVSNISLDDETSNILERFISSDGGG